MGLGRPARPLSSRKGLWLEGEEDSDGVAASHLLHPQLDPTNITSAMRIIPSSSKSAWTIYLGGRAARESDNLH